ncbi:MAG: DUF2254 domain-containing protein [Deltaproteobacteria bacterium]|nr:MAG: DUF2254 domain-containing protein [Deltaproteobacteria bacterium]
MLMKIFLKSKWHSLRTTFWFVPSIMTFSAVIAALSASYVDRRWGPVFSAEKPYAWLYGMSPEAAGSFLSVLASSMVGVAGVTFSITMVALTLASSQFGPRLLRNFMKDWGNQISLGTFVSTFVYCLLCIRFLPAPSASKEPSHLQFSVSIAVLLALVCIAVLIYFIHHVATQLQVEQLISNLSHEMDQKIAIFGDEQEQSLSTEDVEKCKEQIPEDFDEASESIRAEKSGYIQAIDYDNLLHLATQHSLLLHLFQKTSTFVSYGHPLMKVYGASGELDEELSEKLRGCVLVATKLSSEQDLAFDIRQIVEIAVRALSPGTNDPFTANQCIDALRNGLVQLVNFRFPSRYRLDEENKLRLIYPTLNFTRLLDLSFHQIRQNAANSVSVRLRMLEALAIISTHTQNQTHLECIRQHALMIQRGSEREGVLEESDQETIQEFYEMVCKALKAVGWETMEHEAEEEVEEEVKEEETSSSSKK